MSPTLTSQSVSTEIFQLILPWFFPTRLIHTLGGSTLDNAFYHFYHENTQIIYLSLPYLLLIFTSFQQKKYTTSAINQNKILLHFFLSVWRSQKAKYMVLCYTKNRIECSRLEEVWWKVKQWLQCPPWGWEQERIGKWFHKENQTFASHTPDHKARYIYCTSKRASLQEWCSAFHP